MHVIYVHSFPMPSRRAHALQIFQTARALAERGHLVDLFVKSEEKDVSVHVGALVGRTPANLRVHNLGVTRFAGTGYRLRLLHAMLFGRDDVVFFGRQLRQTEWLLNWRRRLRRATPVIYEFHNLEHVLSRDTDPKRATALERSERFVARACNDLIAISKPLADDIGLLHSSRAPHVIEDGVAVDGFRSVVPGIEEHPIRLTYAGSLYRHKGVDRLLDMMESLDSRFRLTLIGGNDESDLRRLKERCAADPSLRERVDLTGHVPALDIPNALSGTHLLLLPASDDPRIERYTSPLKLFEYMAAGIPIIAAKTTSFCSVLDDGLAYFANGISGSELAAAVRRAVDDRRAWPDRGRRAREQAERYSWDERAARIARVLEATLQTR